MTSYGESNYKIFELAALPPGLFGTTYVIVTALKTENKDYIGEFYIFTHRPAPDLVKHRFYCSEGVPMEGIDPVDLRPAGASRRCATAIPTASPRSFGTLLESGALLFWM